MLALGAMLQVDSLSFGYEQPVFKSLNFCIDLGGITQLEGPNGAGKTTLLRILAGVLLPSSGEIFWKGTPVSRGRPRIGYVPATSASFYPRLTVTENLEYFAALCGIPAAKARDLMRAADPFGIDFWKLPLEACSQGMRQKVSWIRALMHDPEILLLDEAWNALDVESEQVGLAAVVGGRSRRVTLFAQHGKRHSFPVISLARQNRAGEC